MLTDMKITVIFDNNQFSTRLIPKFGFSCVVDTGSEKILFDTGSDGDVLLQNLQKEGFDPGGFNLIFISHLHWDHTGGLERILEAKKDIPVFLPDDATDDYIAALREGGTPASKVTTPIEINNGIYSTGSLPGRKREHALVIETSSGLAVITGCAHPGIVKIAETAKSVVKRDICLLLGGFHLRDTAPAAVNDTIERLIELGIERVCPLHCTGDSAREQFASSFNDRCILGGVGLTVKIPDK